MCEWCSVSVSHYRFFRSDLTALSVNHTLAREDPTIEPKIRSIGKAVAKLRQFSFVQRWPSATDRHDRRLVLCQSTLIKVVLEYN